MKQSHTSENASGQRANYGAIANHQDAPFTLKMLDSLTLIVALEKLKRKY